jgi:hypothetical protein
MRLLAGWASALAVVPFGLAGCAAASHPAADTVPRPASQTVAAGSTSPQTAARARTAVRLAAPLLKCADPVAPGRALGSGYGARAATGQASQMAALGGSASPIPLATAGQATVRQVGVVNLSQPGLVVLCGPVNVHCPPGFGKLYLMTRSAGPRPRSLLPYPAVCVARFRGHPMPPEPQLTPVPVATRPLHTMPPQAAGS